MRKFNVTVNGKTYSVDVEEVGEGVSAPVTTTVSAPAPAAKPVVGDGTPIKAPMPGLILGLARKDGDTVKKNEKVVVLEAMKMENDINAPADGVITYVVKKGDNVDTGAVLAYIK
ncbi:MAG: acetyl-CoA carboxylase biotin carboxyl carrier protein subunit [Clostridiales bacterium]|nr:acetyl-CoA carboxylase biotin carboxyl carrier protein subunit [Clostridiales bacterium]